jgi:hypothetical protein
MLQKFITVHTRTQTKRNSKPFVKYYIAFALLFGLMYQVNAQSIGVNPGKIGTNSDIYVVNRNANEEDAAVRLQTQDANNKYRDWLMTADREGLFKLLFWDGNSHQTADENKYEKTPLTLTEDGDLTVTGNGKFGGLLLESDSNEISITNSKFENKPMITQNSNGKIELKGDGLDIMMNNVDSNAEFRSQYNELPRGRAIEVSSGKNLFLVL